MKKILLTLSIILLNFLSFSKADDISISNSIMNFTSNLGSMFGNLIQNIQSIGSSIINVFSYLRSILKALWLGLSSLLTPVGEMISDVVGNGAIVSAFDAIDSISNYIGGPATVFFMTLFVIVLIRIVIAFVFKLLRMNIDYEARKTNWAKGKEQSWEKHISESIDEFENGRRIFHG